MLHNSPVTIANTFMRVQKQEIQDQQLLQELQQGMQPVNEAMARLVNLPFFQYTLHTNGLGQVPARNVMVTQDQTAAGALHIQVFDPTIGGARELNISDIDPAARQELSAHAYQVLVEANRVYQAALARRLNPIAPPVVPLAQNHQVAHLPPRAPELIEQQVAALQAQVALLTNQNAQLLPAQQQEIARLQQDLQDKDRKIEQDQASLLQAQQRNVGLSAENTRLGADNRDLLTQLQALSGQLRGATNAHQQELIQIRQSIQELRDQINQKDEQIAALRGANNNIPELERSIREKQALLEQHQQNIAALENANRNLQQEINGNKVNIQKLEGTLNENKAHLENYNAVLCDLAIEEQNNNHLKKQLETIRAEITEVQLRNQALNDASTENLATIERLEQQTTVLKSQLEDLERLRLENAELKTKIRTLEQEKAQLEEQLGSMQALQETNIQLRQRIQELESTLDTAGPEKVTELKEKLSALQEKMKELEHLTAENNAYEILRQQNVDKIDKLEKSISEIENKLTTTETESKEKNQTLDDLKKQLEALQEERTKILEEIETLRAELKTSGNDNTELANKLKKLEEEKAETDKALAAQTKTSTAQAEEIETLRNQLKTSGNDNAELADKLKKLEKEKAETDISLAAQTKTSTARAEEIENLRSQFNTSGNANAELSDKLKKLEEEKAETDKALAAQTETSKAQADEIETLRNQLKTSGNANTELADKLKKLEGEKAETDKALAAQTDITKAQAEELKTLRAQLQVLNQTNAENTANLETLKDQKAANEIKLASRKKRIAELKEEQRNVQANLAKTERQLDTAQKEKEDLEKRSAKLEEQNTAQKSVIVKKDQEITEEKEKSQKVNAELAELRASMEKLKAEFGVESISDLANKAIELKKLRQVACGLIRGNEQLQQKVSLKERDIAHLESVTGLSAKDAENLAKVSQNLQAVTAKIKNNKDLFNAYWKRIESGDLKAVQPHIEPTYQLLHADLTLKGELTPLELSKEFENAGLTATIKLCQTKTGMLDQALSRSTNAKVSMKFEVVISNETTRITRSITLQSDKVEENAMLLLAKQAIEKTLKNIKSTTSPNFKESVLQENSQKALQSLIAKPKLSNVAEKYNKLKKKSEESIRTSWKSAMEGALNRDTGAAGVLVDLAEIFRQAGETPALKEAKDELARLESRLRSIKDGAPKQALEQQIIAAQEKITTLNDQAVTALLDLFIKKYSSVESILAMISYIQSMNKVDDKDFDPLLRVLKQTHQMLTVVFDNLHEKSIQAKAS